MLFLLFTLLEESAVARNIPPLKARPETIIRILLIIEDSEGDFKKIEDGVIDYWRKTSIRRTEPSRKNSLRAVFGPTLRHLQLIRGEGDGIKLLPKAKELLESYEHGGEILFKQKLAEHLVKLEETRWVRILSALEDHEFISIELLLRTVLGEYPVSAIDKSKLRKYLAYLEYVGLISTKNGKIVLRKTLYEITVAGLQKDTSLDQFLKALFEGYEELRKKQTSSYVPIPEVKDTVVEKLGIWPDQFDEWLKKIPKETNEYLIHLTQPMVRESGGLEIVGKYFYYICVIQKRDEDGKPRQLQSEGESV
jgi:hypothetical protein